MVKVKRERKPEVVVDRISSLPTEVLGFILSFLTLKEATATSILSHRWKNLWTLIPKLDLDGKLLRKRKRSKLEKERCYDSVLSSHQNARLGKKVKRSKLEKERCNYVKWVDSVVCLHQSSDRSSNLEEFRVASDLSIDEGEHIDRWLSYALSRSVQRLDLNLNNVKGDGTWWNYDEHYTFPYKKGNFPDNFKLLRSLSMHLVSVSGEALGFFLANCPHLERLSVTESQVLSSLEIIRPFPSFNYLEISLCHKLKSVVVRDSNLVTIKFYGNRIKFQLVNVPLLTQLWIGGPLTERMDDVARMFPSVLPQLETFKIHFSYRAIYRKGTRRFASAIEMCNLKQLVVSLWPNYAEGGSIIPIIYLINASPRLQRFVLEAPRTDNKHQASRDCFIGAGLVSKMMPKAYSHHLKEVEFVGYHGEICQFALMKSFVEKDIALEKIIVDPRCFTYRSYNPWVRIPRGKIEEVIAARAYAKKQLKKCLPSRINVKIL